MTQRANPDDCKPEAGALIPVIDRSRCEAKGDCVEVCPFDVFAIRKLTPHEKQDLSMLTRVKVFVHGGRQAFAVHADQCHSCGACVTACPERAITLRKP
jgi:NAD-dependent dihydropyrimidine dehydrogenase PreA subunit